MAPVQRQHRVLLDSVLILDPGHHAMTLLACCVITASCALNDSGAHGERQRTAITLEIAWWCEAAHSAVTQVRLAPRGNVIAVVIVAYKACLHAMCLRALYCLEHARVYF